MKLSNIAVFITGSALCAAAGIPDTRDKTNQVAAAEPIPDLAGAEAPQYRFSDTWFVRLTPEIRENVVKPAWLKEWSRLEFATFTYYKYNMTELLYNGNLTETAMRWAYITMSGWRCLDVTSEETARYKEEEANETEMKYLWATGRTYEDWCFDILEPLCEKAKNENNNSLPDACVPNNQHDVVFDFIDILYSRPEGITESTKEEFLNHVYAYKPKA